MISRAKWREGVKILIWIWISVGLTWLIWVSIRLLAPELSLPGTAPHISFAELAAVLLTGLALALAILGLLIAVLAIWGYKAIRDESRTIAKNTAQREAQDQIVQYLNSPAGVNLVQNEVAKRLDDLKEGLALAQSYSQSQAKDAIIVPDTDKERVGKPLPPRKEAK